MLSSAVYGVTAYPVEVEVDIRFGLPVFNIVGLPEVSVRESRERVKAAINNSGYAFPADRITVNLAPADIKKEGTGFDLPIAIGILAATGIIDRRFASEFLLLGELSLDGRIKPVKGSLSIAIAAKNARLKGIIVPFSNGMEAAVVRGISVLPVKHLSQVVEFFRGSLTIKPLKADMATLLNNKASHELDFSHVQGQEHVKRAMEVAATGSHNFSMEGPPGSGKTMLARLLPTIMPPMTMEEAIETTAIYSVAGMLDKDQPLVVTRPFRAPHHTISDVGLTGGGNVPKPGEISLAHNGVLFLDELSEFRRNALEALRQPVEDHIISISRASYSVIYPASFMFISAMNPCPCGFFSDSTVECRCSPSQIQRYRSKISGPLLDRIDIHIEVPAVDKKDIMSDSSGEPSSSICERVTVARTVQTRRFAGLNIYSNAQMNSRQVKTFCRMGPQTGPFLESVMEKLNLSARAYHRILKISRTIADLDGSIDISVDHISEAVQYRVFDRQHPFYK